jgi:hypothetical protein
MTSPLVMRGDYFMTEHHTERTTTEARAGVTGQGVRYVLVLSLAGAIMVFAAMLYFWSA